MCDRRRCAEDVHRDKTCVGKEGRRRLNGCKVLLLRRGKRLGRARMRARAIEGRLRVRLARLRAVLEFSQAREIERFKLCGLGMGRRFQGLRRMLARDLRVGAEKTVGAKRLIGSCRWRGRRLSII